MTGVGHRERRLPRGRRGVLRRDLGPADRRRGPGSPCRWCRWRTSTPRPRRCPSWPAEQRQERRSPILRHQEPDLYFREHGDRIGIGPTATARCRDTGTDGRSKQSDVWDSVAVTGARCRRCCPSPTDDFEASWGAAWSCCPRLAGAKVEEGLQRGLLVHPRRLAAAGRAPGAPRVLDRRGGVGDALRRRRPGRWPSGWSTGSRRPTARVRPLPLRGRPARARRTCTQAQQPELRRGLRHPPPAAADGASPGRCGPAVPPAAAGSWARCFLQAGGWERPHWFEANAGLPKVRRRARPRDGGRPATGRPIAGAEALATQRACGACTT